MDQSLIESNQKIEKAIDHFKAEMSAIRAGRANPSLIENILVDAYGGKCKLVEVGTIASPQPSLLTVQVWDVSLLNATIKAIQESNLGLNPNSDGQLIRLPIPPLTSERREELIKVLLERQEDARIEIRQIRQEIRQEWVKAEENDEFGEDELKRREKLLQDLIDKKIEEVESLGKEKQAQLTEI